MKISVVSKTGAQESLTLTGSWQIAEGREFSCLVGPSGLSYFFTSSGEYEGWGMKLFRAPEQAADNSTADRYKIFLERDRSTSGSNADLA